MAEAVVGPAVEILLQTLISVSKEQISLFRDFNKDLQKLKDSVSIIQDLLEDAEKKQVTHKAVKRWLNKLENLAFHADNVLDELTYQHLSNKIETQYKLDKVETRYKMKKKVRCFFPGCIPNSYRLKMARKIKNINGTMKEINEEASEYGLLRTLAGASAYAPAAGSSDPSGGLETDAFSIDPVFLGREDDVTKIVELMTTTPNENEKFSILPIVGMGGLGKSTIAREVFHHEKIKAHFDKHLWVHVSQNYDVVILLKKVLTSLTRENVQLGNKQVLFEELQKNLGVKRFLLVLDDVWNENSKEWEDFIIPLSNICSGTGNGIIVTTRSEKVASLVKTLPIHKLKDLSVDNCWSIVKVKAFGEANVPSEFGIIGKSIAKRCQGLPLAAKVVGGLLRDKSSDEWLSIEKNWLSDSGNENFVSNILKLSYDHLSPSSLKKCFAYCSIFPKGFVMDSEQLIELWMAEGFLSQNDMEIGGNKFLNRLLQNSLLQVGWKDDYGNITHCNMHDLVHDLASSVLSPNINGNLLDDTCQVRYICRQTFNEESCHKECLRTLFFNGKVSDIMFSDFKSLHVLILRSDLYYEMDAIELPSSIGELIHLRCFDFSEVRIECLPDSIGELYQLQTLRASFCLVKLPNTLKYLINLRHLHTHETELPPEMGRLTSLQTLPRFGVGNEKGCQIGELGSLKNLKGKLEIYNLEKVHDKEEAKSADLFQKGNIFKLNLAWDEDREGENNDANVLEGLQPHPNLKSLKISGFRGRCFPSWCSNMTGLVNLMKIRLEKCKECEEVPMLGHLPHLESLCLRHLDNVRSIGPSFYRIDNCSSRSSSFSNGVCTNTITVFPALESLELWKMPKLTEWLEAELSENQQSQLVVFPCLQYLQIYECSELMRAPSHFPHLEKLDISDMKSGLPLANICGVNLISLTELNIRSISDLTCLPEWLFCNNQNLSRLEVRSCPKLTHLVPSFGASLRELRINNCSNLEKLPDDLYSFSADLESFHIQGCGNLKLIVPYDPRGGLSPGRFTSVRELFIKFFDGPTTLPSEMIIGCLHKMPRLSSLAIDVGMITNPAVIEDISRSLGTLRHLSITYSYASWDCVSFNMTVDAMLRGSITQSLQILKLYGVEHWDTLPNQLQHLTALSYLELIGFGIEALPEWFGNLSSLQSLDLVACKILGSLPSKEAMQRLTKLTLLSIYDCPVLAERCIEQERDDHDSQWPKISHINYVSVDHRRIRTHAH